MVEVAATRLGECARIGDDVTTCNGVFDVVCTYSGAGLVVVVGVTTVLG